MNNDSPHYVTPEEADEKLCPMAKQQQNAEWEYYCDGPKCMAWRWRHMRYENEKDPETGAWPAIYSKTHGYCGMVRS